MQTVPLGNQIVDKKKFLFVEVSQIMNEEELKVKYHHFLTLNESIDLGIELQNAAIITKKRDTQTSCAPLMEEHNTISEADFPKS